MEFRIHKMKPAAREAFRWSPHTGGQAVVKQKDYEPGGQVEAASEYAAWKLLSERGDALLPGDVLELAGEPEGVGPLRIAKYIGFEPASWWVAPPKSASNGDNALSSVPNDAESPSSL